MNTEQKGQYEATTLPFRGDEGVLVDYLLHLADDALILAHRDSEWCGHGPVLELDIAISNIALDLLGQARNFYQYAAETINNSGSHRKASPMGGGLEGAVAASEDTLAYLRNANEFKNCLLVEQSNGDWGVTIMRQFFFSTYQYYLYLQLQNSNDERIKAIATKALKEVTYHVRWSSEWVIRLGTGTEESHTRMINAVNTLNGYTSELFIPAEYETIAAEKRYGTDITALKSDWLNKVQEIFAAASLTEAQPISEHNTLLFGKEGQHTDNLESILSDMQLLQRTYPGAEW